KDDAREYFSGKKESTDKSGEIAVNVIAAIAGSEPVMEVVNMVNVGQVDNLPRGFALETNGMIHASGYTPLAVGPVPDVLKNVLEPHIVSQSMLVDACLERNRKKALEALLVNPMCFFMATDDIMAMGKEALEANKKFSDSI
ncbi:MAG TPA: hypothetical protein DC049_01715, partial [Spirochaetia bacterium]|nr:hypothetical protein [Spirochaetia bacterium]